MENKPFIIKSLETFLEHLIFIIGVIIQFLFQVIIFSPLIYAMYLVIHHNNWKLAIIVFILYVLTAIAICQGYYKYKDYKISKALYNPWRKNN